MSQAKIQRVMLETVASALGPALCAQVAFVGGCTTALFLTDAAALHQVRHTEDVDLIVSVLGYGQWHQLQQQLRAQGFRDDPGTDGPICAMWLQGLRVDFTPDDSAVLGFSNQWYPPALKTATAYPLSDTCCMRLVRPEYFIATKLEAWLGRGNDDPEGSQDIEDLLTLFDGRAEIVQDLAMAEPGLRQWCAAQLQALCNKRGFERAIEGTARGNRQREDLIHARIAAITLHDKAGTGHFARN